MNCRSNYTGEDSLIEKIGSPLLGSPLLRHIYLSNILKKNITKKVKKYTLPVSNKYETCCDSIQS